MRHTLQLVVFACAMSAAPFCVQAQTAPTAGSYRVYDATGKPATIEQALDAIAASDAVFVGEIHNDQTAHQIELQLLEGTQTRLAGDAQKHDARPLVLSLEMFERDVQLVLDEYLAGLILERQFLAGSRPWSNYQTDYRPLVEFARTHNVPVVAANAPERYVNRVSRLGRDALKVLTPAARGWLAPLPYGAASPASTAKFQQAMAGGMTGQGTHNNPFLLDAQLLRDATMAHSIAEQLKRQKHALVLHINGSFHSESRLGTPEQLHTYNSHAHTLVITILPVRAGASLDAHQLNGLGDFVFVTETAPTSRF
jgi:uncharacterized iron-regulated protein